MRVGGAEIPGARGSGDDDVAGGISAMLSVHCSGTVSSLRQCHRTHTMSQDRGGRVAKKVENRTVEPSGLSCVQRPHGCGWRS